MYFLRSFFCVFLIPNLSSSSLSSSSNSSSDVYFRFMQKYASENSIIPMPINGRIYAGGDMFRTVNVFIKSPSFEKKYITGENRKPIAMKLVNIEYSR